MSSLTTKYLEWSFFKKSRHLGFGVLVHDMRILLPRDPDPVRAGELRDGDLHGPNIYKDAKPEMSSLTAKCLSWSFFKKSRHLRVWYLYIYFVHDIGLLLPRDPDPVRAGELLDGDLHGPVYSV